ncbi:hypothetical protein SAMN05192529_13427 [Arachidicoccus rhizosphaerae]|uniref:Glycoside hydrolase 123 C-terminal domain-containing protein n=1 Tax=Arachidicoccus rhizosphaerae TaxID=551991 RepID=A0A1H4CPT5_9BACT|nr:hypothetical protein [Arachidicoccus rhizosphaerae]SEA62319.1 hypothetical protein SAMN05192529_13427 [Arachidicoccus rhizosphaerae]
MKGFFIYLFSVLTFVQFSCAQKVNGWYYPWMNSLNNLVKAGLNDTVPLLKGGVNYRIFKVSNESDLYIQLKENKNFDKNLKVELFSVPVIKNYKGQSILDVLYPLSDSTIVIKPKTTSYFLVKFACSVPGYYKYSFHLRGGRLGSTEYTQNIFVGNSTSVYPFPLNVWAYFDYPLIANLSGKVLVDLRNHGVNVLVIPPSKLGGIENPDGMRDTELKLYLDKANNDKKFDYYLLFLNYRNLSGDSKVLGDTWKKNFIKWYNNIMNYLKEKEIDLQDVYLYPYDEPSILDAQNFVKIKEWCDLNGVKAKFYTTIDKTETLDLINYADIAQIKNNEQLLATLSERKNGKNKSKLWIYDVFSGSRNQAPINYLSLAWKSVFYELNGYGIWNYADVANGFEKKQLESIKSENSQLGFWNLTPTQNNRDYSLIYRRGNSIFPSLRWEAAYYAKEDFAFLSLYCRYYGIKNTRGLINALIERRESLSKWEKIKLSLLR